MIAGSNLSPGKDRHLDENKWIYSLVKEPPLKWTVHFKELYPATFAKTAQSDINIECWLATARQEKIARLLNVHRNELANFGTLSQTV